MATRGAKIWIWRWKGEIKGRCGVSWSSIKIRHGDWLAENKINVLVQLGFKRHPDISNVPLVQEFAKSEDDKNIFNLLLTPQNIGRPYFTPPGVPQDRLEALRAAFDATVKDPDFIASAKKRRMEINPLSGKELQKMLQDIYSSDPKLIARARKAIK